MTMTRDVRSKGTKTMLRSSIAGGIDGSSSSEKEWEDADVGPQNRSDGFMSSVYLKTFLNSIQTISSPFWRRRLKRAKSVYSKKRGKTKRALHRRYLGTNLSTSSIVFVMVFVLTINVMEMTISVTAAYNNDDTDDYYTDDYYDDDNANYHAYNDDAAGKYSAADDAVDLNDDYYKPKDTKDDDYMDLVQDGMIGVEDIAFMPISCINYHNGHMIKFELFENQNNYQCHFKNLGTHVVSISHFMRAYFNQQAVIYGDEFSLPGDAGYLNCVLLQQTAYSNEQLYAKIGCMDRETFTSTKLQLHVYSDKKCTERYQDGQTDAYHSSKGYEINGYTFSTKTSFRPPFYSCQTCKPNQISETFLKKNYWYDDDYISQYGRKRNEYGDDDYVDDVGNYTADDDSVNSLDDKFYFSANDDGDDYGSSSNDDDFYKYEDDDDKENRNRKKRHLSQETSETFSKSLIAANGALERYEDDFWMQMGHIRRRLEDGGDIGDWNFCERIHTYGVWCDKECRAIDTFRVDEWSKSDTFLLAIMCMFMAAMMLLIFAKRVKAYEKAKIFDGEIEMQVPGLPPFAMAIIFVSILLVIVIMANLKFVNETLVFSVVQCILLFMYMLKLTLFERQTPAQLLSMRRKPNGRLGTMNRHLFDS